MTFASSYLLADIGTEIEKFSVNSVQGRLQQVALTRILRIKQLQQLDDEALVNVLFGNGGLKRKIIFKKRLSGNNNYGDLFLEYA